MKRVKSLDDLKRVALSRGAVLELDGQRFNTTGDRAYAKRQVEPPPEPEPKPPEPEPQRTVAEPQAYSGVVPDVVFDRQPVTEQIAVHLDMAPVAKAIEGNNERPIEVLAEGMRQLPVQPTQERPHSWVFKIKRDTRGFIESVQAEPIIGKTSA